MLSAVFRLAVLVPVFGFTSVSPSAVAPPAGAPPWTTHPNDVASERFDGSAVRACLAEGRRALEQQTTVLNEMRLELLHPTPSGGTCDEPGLGPFDGQWRGRWGARPVRHVWRRVSRAVQLVVFEDGSPHLGVNIEHDGVLCGIVRDAAGRERLHQGRAFVATPHSPAYVKWMTPDRVYYERVACRQEGRVYEIAEYRVTANGLRPGVRARYREADRPGVLGRTPRVGSRK